MTGFAEANLLRACRFAVVDNKLLSFQALESVHSG
jgi:hypothetical protein